LTWQEQRHGDAYILSVVVHMTKKTSGYLCKYMTHIVVEGLDHRSGETSGTRMPTGISMKLCRGMCNYIDDGIAKECILGFTGSTGMSLPKTG
jgi:hypothetical protein